MPPLASFTTAEVLLIIVLCSAGHPALAVVTVAVFLWSPRRARRG